jgi:integrase
MRKGELLSLTWGQIDFGQGRINLRAIDTKAKQARSFPMTSELREILEKQREETDKLERLKRIKVLHVFHRNGQKISTFYSAWRTACKNAKYAGKLLHDFRRTAVRNFVRKGIPEKVAMMLSGHKTRDVFERYNIVSESDVLDAGKRLEEGSNQPNGYKTVTIG